MKKEKAEKIEFVCPKCKGELDSGEISCYKCYDCKNTYSIYFGIPDFRLFPPPNLDIESDIRQSTELMKTYSRLNSDDFSKKVHLRFDDSPEDLKQRYRDYDIEQEQRGKTRLKTLNDQIGMLSNPSELKRDFYLEIGCGKGGAISVASKQFNHVVGIDILLKQLICTKKLFDERGISSVTLCCACAEHLPFKDEAFNVINSVEVIEHVNNSLEVFRETKRVLLKNGYFGFDSPNRFTVWFECHVCVWGVGFVPEKHASRYVELIKRVEYVGTNPLSYFDLKRELQQTFPDRYKVLPSLLDAKEHENPKRKLGRLVYDTIMKVPVISTLLFFFIHKYDVICIKR